jgi:hypothetical protein
MSIELGESAPGTQVFSASTMDFTLGAESF